MLSAPEHSILLSYGKSRNRRCRRLSSTTLFRIFYKVGQIFFKQVRCWHNLLVYVEFYSVNFLGWLRNQRKKLNMYGFSKRHFNIRHTMSVVIVIVYAIVASAIDLFHNEDCHFGTANTDATDVIFCNDPCPACAFFNSSNSTEANSNSALVSTTIQVISQPSPCLTIVNHYEWACSIMLRAPPSITIS